MAKILKLKRHNENKEIEFEVMVKKTKEILGLLEQSGYRRPFEIIKREK